MMNLSLYFCLLLCMIEKHVLATGETGCDATFSGSSGTITSPRFPHSYDNDLDCKVTILTRPNYNLLVTFDQFNVEYSNRCVYDSLEIDGKHFCGQILPPAFISKDHRLNMRFKTDASESKKGWRLKYVSVCTQCNGICSVVPGMVVSHGYPHGYQGLQRCTYNLTVPNGNLVVKFLDFSLEQSEGTCAYEHFRFLEGTAQTQKHCGGILPPPLLADGNSALVEFKTDRDSEHRGWKLSFDECGGNYHGNYGIISSPFYPSNYTNNLRCMYKISVPQGSVRVSFHNLHIEGTWDHCDDYLLFGDPVNKNKTRICGDTAVETVVTSLGEILTLDFVTDRTVTRMGWMLRYEAHDRDGQWSEWASWSSTSVTCGQRTRSRQRTCTNPSPVGNGRSCAGEAIERDIVAKPSCGVPVGGSWSNWANWSSCSKSCGNGVQVRRRLCRNPAPAFGGKQCKGRMSITRPCNTHNCPVEGQWSTWTVWSICSQSCGGGQQTRSRTCSNPSPAFGGEQCAGSSSVTQTCNTDTCPVDGQWSVWTEWSICSKSCGDGQQIRNRTCSNPSPAFGGEECGGPSSVTQSCKTDTCPVDGQWSIWTAWSICSESCGDGQQMRNRTCNNPLPAFGGEECGGPSSVTQSCKTDMCPVDGQWSIWTAWSICSQSCGGGQQMRNRTCSNPSPAFGGEECGGPSSVTQSCKTDTCPVDGQWSIWTAWSICSESCGDGQQMRNRTCNNPSPAFGGKECAGSSTVTQSCNMDICLVDGLWSIWTAWSVCSQSCGGGQQMRTRSNPSPAFRSGDIYGGPSSVTQSCNTDACPVYGQWSIWTAWSTCSKSCGGGQQMRNRTCSNPSPAFGGQACGGPSSVTQSCNTDACPVDGQWSIWPTWSICSKSCGGGQQMRNRTCSNPSPAFGGQACGGPSSITQSCNTDACPVDGQWSIWPTWSICSKSCGGGQQMRNRTCNNPSPAFGGQECTGSSTVTQTCNTDKCSVDGQWSIWTAWSTCSRTCGGGIQGRTRLCNSPSPMFGGANCVGNLTEGRTCSTKPCPVHGAWSHWSNYTVCSVSCGYGTQSRLRTCSNPPPSKNGQWCLGDDNENRTCTAQACRVNGQWSAWSNWGGCSVVCGGGVQYRARTCSNPAPSIPLGAPCIGTTIASRLCNRSPCSEMRFCNGSSTYVAICGLWSDWSSCSTECKRWKKRFCHGNETCVTLQRTVEPCVDCGSMNGGKLSGHNTGVTVILSPLAAVVVVAVLMIIALVFYRKRRKMNAMVVNEDEQVNSYDNNIYELQGTYTAELTVAIQPTQDA